MEDCLQYNEITETYYAATQISVPQGCNGWLAVNTGDTPMRINQRTILPRLVPGGSGESCGTQGNRGEIFKGNNGVITLQVLPPVGTNPQVQVTFKFYLSLK
jgi:hypothetical protein